MEISHLENLLKEKNLRITQARKEIYQILQKSEHSLSPKELYNLLCEESQNQTDPVSVYRNLNLFSDLGLAHRFQDGKYSSCHQEPLGQKSLENKHIHFISHCSQCGKSSEIKTHSQEICNLAKKIKKISKTLKDFHEIVIQGRCSDCH